MAKNMYQKRAERKAKAIEEKTDKGGLQKTVINWYPGHMAKAKRLISENIDLVDVVYEVIDARIPYSSKVIDINSYTKNKPRLLIMTKKDLCDIQETTKWIEYYQSEGYKVLLTDLEHNFNSKTLIQMTNELIEEQNKKREKKGMISRKPRVLIVGIPNAGKSTLINRLVGKNVTATGNKPGVTKDLNWIRAGEKLELLDTPGILWPKIDVGNVAYNLASLTAIKEEILPLYDIIIYILEMLTNYYPDILKTRYKLDSLKDDANELLEDIGKKRGCISKGEIDYDKIMNIIINDVKSGIIRGITFDRYE